MTLNIYDNEFFSSFTNLYRGKIIQIKGFLIFYGKYLPKDNFRKSVECLNQKN